MFSLFSFISNVGTYLSEFLYVVLVCVGIALMLFSFVPAAALGPVALALPGVIGTIARKVLRYVAVALILFGLCQIYITRQIAAHDASYAATQALAVSQAEAAALKRGAASAAQQASKQSAREQHTSKIKAAIANDPTSQTCRDDPAFDAAAAELRLRHGARKDAATR